MRARVFSGDSGRMSSRRPPQGHVLPVSTKMYKELFRVSRPEGQIDGYSRDLNLWSFEGALYRLQYTEWDKHHFLLVDPAQRDFVARGRRWLLSEGRLALADRTISTEFPFPVPNILATKVDPWVKSWVETGRADDAPIADLAECSGGLFFDKWGWLPLPLYHVKPNREYYELLAYIQKLYNNSSPHVEAFMARLKDIPKEEVTEISNVQQLYTVSYYDTFPGRTEEMFELSSRGGAWIENGKLYSNGEFTVGEAFLIPTVFQADGTCWGVSLVNSGALSVPDPSHFIPKPGGVSAVSWRDGEGRGELIACNLPRQEVKWSVEVKGPDGKTQNVMRIDEFTAGQLGTTEGEQFISRTFQHFGMARSFFMEPELIRAWLPPVEGEPERVEGGRCRTIEEWCASEAGAVQGAAGPFLIDEESDHTRLTDFRTLRRHILPGRFADIPERRDGIWATSVREAKGSVVVEESPLAHDVEQATLFSHSIAPEHVIAPWRASIGQSLEIGWWDFPQVGLTGSPPNHEWLNKDWSGQGEWMHGGRDHHWGDLGWHRSSLSITSDGYVYFTADLSGGNAAAGGDVTAFAFKYNGEEWETGRSNFYVSDTRVAPLGQGCYNVYHYPGEDWSIFHAPVGEVNYRQLWQSTDWSFLWSLTGLAGGFALAGQLMVQEAFNKYYEATIGNLMLIYTLPRQTMIVMSPMMDSIIAEVAREDGSFWSFTGWALIDNAPCAIFSRMGMSLGTSIPEVWAVGRNGAKKIEASEAGEAGERAIVTIPSSYYPRFGQMPTGNSSPGWDLMFPGEVYHYPLPELPTEAGTEMAHAFLERLELLQSRASHVNAPRITMGQTFNHQVFSSAVVDPALPLIDLRLQMDEEGQAWVLLRHESGVWFSIRADLQIEKYDFEIEGAWYLLSAGIGRDGSVVAQFGCGILDMDTYRTFDYQLHLYFGMGYVWHNNAIWKWPARIIPVAIAQNAGELQKLFALIKKEEE